MKKTLKLWLYELRVRGFAGLLRLPSRAMWMDEELQLRGRQLHETAQAKAEVMWALESEKKYRAIAESRVARECRGRETAERMLDETRRGAVGVLSLRADEQERLAMLLQAAARVTEAGAGVLRNGYAYVGRNATDSHRTVLEKEVGKLRAVLDLMSDRGDLRAADVARWRRSAMPPLLRFSRFQGVAAQAPGDTGMECIYCGPGCAGGAAHNARLEDGELYKPAAGNAAGD